MVSTELLLFFLHHQVLPYIVGEKEGMGYITDVSWAYNHIVKLQGQLASFTIVLRRSFSQVVSNNIRGG